MSGCYLTRVDPADVSSGPVLAEYREYGGSIVFASGCLNGGSGGYLWRAPAKPVVTAAAVRARVVRLIPTAAIGLAPRTATLVNIQTIVWVDAPPTRALPTVTILGQQVRIGLRLDHVVYAFGDGTTDADGPAGTAYDATNRPCRTRECPGYYGHTYTHTGRDTITATAYWHATYTVNGGPIRQVPATVPGPAAATTLAVRQARAVLVPNP